MKNGQYDYKTKQTIVAEHLRNEILVGSLMPGQKLDQDGIAEDFGVSRTPIREALRTLEAEGLVIFRPHRGATVADVSAEELSDIVSVRIVLERMAGRLGAESMTPEGLAHLRELLSQMEDMRDNPVSWTRVHHAFHMTIYEASNSKLLCKLIGELRGRMQPYMRIHLLVPELARQGYTEHFGILNACKRNDGVLVERLLEEHIKRSATALQTHLGAKEDHGTA